MHCIGELMLASARCPGFSTSLSTVCRAWATAAIIRSDPMTMMRSTSGSRISAFPSFPRP